MSSTTTRGSGCTRPTRVVAAVEGDGHLLRQVVGECLGQLPEEVDELRVGQRREGGTAGPGTGRLTRHVFILTELRRTQAPAWAPKVPTPERDCCAASVE